jgi:GSH-dependent disulfide-bond oxidoreductase
MRQDNMPLHDFPISKRWPARHPERLQLYSSPTQNGVKISAMLEEIGLPYEPHFIDLGQGDNHTAEFLSLNPNGRIPATRDPDGANGTPLILFESGAILVYLAEKTGKLLPSDAALRYQTIQWVFFQTSAMGPMFGQLGYFFKAGGREIEDKRPLERYRMEAMRLLQVLDNRLAGRIWVMGDDVTIADLACFAPVHFLIGYYQARDLVAFDLLKHVPGWLDRVIARPAVLRGLSMPARP